ncbi:MAG TPA: group 1 truncated hemoglobin, partial [Kofleriaceae bacterium]|nr:group 1 truncated hemoglobin [Kofleriaceae bacterium]
MSRSIVLVSVLAAAATACHGVRAPAPRRPVPAPAPAPAPAADQAAAASTSPAPAPAAAPDGRSLYDRLGGLPAIQVVVADFVGRTTTDPRIMDRFFDTDADALKARLVEFVCVATGGPCQYTGRDMHESHAGMQLVAEEFDALVEDLTAALDHAGVGAREKGELLGALGPLEPQMVVPAGELQPIADERLAEVTAAAAQLGDADAEARRLLGQAVVAGRRGQRS